MSDESIAPRADVGAPADHKMKNAVESLPLTDVADDGFEVAWAMVEASPDGLVMVDDAGLIKLVNRQTEALFGYDRGDLLGRPVEVLLPEAAAGAHELHRAGYRDEPGVRAMGSGLDLWAQRADGSTFPVEVSLSPLTVNGELRVIAAVRDTSERVAAEESARLVRHTIDSVADAVFMCDEETLEFTYANQGAVDMHGYSREELLGGMSPGDLAPSLDPAELQTALEQLAGTPDASARLRTEARHKDGTTVPVEVDINWPAPGSRGGPRPVMAIVRDVSAQVAAEQAVKQSEARFRAAFDEGPVPMTIIEVRPPDGRDMLDVNQALADLFGYRRDELIGRPAAEFIRPADVDPDGSVATAVAAGQDVDDEHLVRGVRADGSEIWLQRHVSALDPDGAQDKLIVHVVDVTARIEADRAQRRQEALTAALSSVRLEMLQGATRSEGLAMLCQVASDLLDGWGAVILTPTTNEGELAIEAAAGVPRSVQARMSFRMSQGAVGDVFQTGEPSYLNSGRHPTTPEANRQILDEHQVGPLLLAPLPDGDGVAGVLVVVRLSDGEPFTDADLDPARQLAAGAVIAIDLAQARLREANVQLLEDRERIGRDMHDHVIGRLFGAGMNLQAGLTVADDPTALTDRVASVVEEIDRAIKDIRNAIYGVRSRTDWGQGVRGAILAVVADSSEALGFEPAVSLGGPIDELPDPIVEDLLAVLREALTNTAKYANATSADVTIVCGPASLEARITDNGDGFTSPGTSADLGGNGLGNMAARAEARDGTIAISSTTDGTIITWTVPLGT